MNGASPELTPYLEARRRARELRLALDRRAVLSIRRALLTYVEELEQLLRARFPDRTIKAGITEEILRVTVQVNELAARRLLRNLIRAIEADRLVTFEEILEIWERAGREAASALGGRAVAGAVRAAPVTLLGAYSSANAASTWQTLIRAHVSNAATQANAIVEGALLEGVGTDELARRLRRYVIGSESFDHAFENVRTLSGEVAKIDLRKLRGPARDAARQMEFNARRIAVTEIGNARREAEVQHGWTDPLIIGWRWTLSPNRGVSLAHVPDACDGLAAQDWYGLGEGVFPYDKVPVGAHPFCRCELRSVARSISQVNEPKPTASRILKVSEMEIPGAEELTEARVAEILRQTRAAIEFGEKAAEAAA